MLSKLSSKTSSRSARYELTSSSSRSKTETPSVAGAASSPNHVVVAIVEGRGGAKGEIGLASMDIRRPQLNLAQFSDTASYTKLRIRLQVLNPVEIIVPDSAIESGGNMSILVETIKVDLTQTKVTPIPRRHFNETKAMESIKTLKTPDCSTIEKDIAEKYYCLSCAGALLNYIEHIQNILFAPSSVKVVYRGVEKTCMLDLSTVKNLELIVSLKNGTDTTNSLFGVLNRTFTSSGQRMLRACILQPSADLNVIEQRLDAIEELLNNEEAFTSLRTWISRVLDVDHLVALCSHVSKSDEAIKTCEYKIAQVIHLKHTLELIEPLRNALASLKSTLFVGYYQSLLDDRFESILNSIREVLNEDVRVEKGSLNTKMQKCFAVKSNINGLLDISRRTYTELLGDTSELCADVVNETHLPFKVSYANGRGFYLSLRINEVCFPKKPPEILINVTRRNNLIQCSTEKMVQLNDRINEIVGEVLFLSNVIVTDVLSNLRNSITCLYNLTEVISCVDFITSLAQVCTISTANMVRPRFMDSLALKQAFHPILEKISPSEVTLNDVFIGPDCNFVIVTGPNMAGKSTYLKMIGLAQIMAQIGSFVPASIATLRLCDQLFTRFGQNDDLESNYSSFEVEMNDVKYILENLSDTSLVLIDELCRCTCSEDGLAIAHAISEHFIDKKAFVIISTHFLDLTNLDGLYPNVANYHFSEQTVEHQTFENEINQQLALNHTLKPGPYRGPLYGFEIAALSSMPKEIIENAKRLAEEIHAKRQAAFGAEIAKRKKDRAIMNLYHKLIDASKQVNVNNEELRVYLKSLKEQYLKEINGLSSASSPVVEHVEIA